MAGRSCASLPSWLRIPLPTLHLAAPAWLTRCLGFDPVAGAREDFTFDRYASDEFDHLLSADPSSGSFLSRLPFKRGSTRRPQPRTDGSSDGSLRSLFVDDRDAQLFGDESISMLLTDQNDAGQPPELPLGHRPHDPQDDENLLMEEEQLRRTEEAEIQRKRDAARRLAIERGLIAGDGAAEATPRSLGGVDSLGTLSSRSGTPSIRSQMSMISRSSGSQGEEVDPGGS